MELARLHIYHVLGLSFQKTADVFHNAVQKPLAAFQRRPCHVGRDDAVGRGQKGIARRDGFFGYYVHSGGAETAAFQRGFYRRFVHETAPGGVDEDGARLHFREGAGVYQLRCRRGEGAVEGDKIRLGEQGVQIDVPRQRFPARTAVRL